MSEATTSPMNCLRCQTIMVQTALRSLKLYLQPADANLFNPPFSLTYLWSCPNCGYTEMQLKDTSILK
jgi:hypothetical protein